MTKNTSTFTKGTDCLTFHEHLFELFLEELNKKNIDLDTNLEEDIRLSIQITAVKRNK